jgi:hypothetical protein
VILAPRAVGVPPDGPGEQGLPESADSMRVGGAQALGRAQTLGVQQRQPGQQPRVQPVGLDVLGVVVPQVS